MHGFSNSTQKYDFTTEAIRSIAKGLGFGTALSGSEDRITYRFHDGKYVFDKNIRNNSGRLLTDFTSLSNELNDFTHNFGYWNYTNYLDYKLYSPLTYNKNLTFCYFDSISSASDNEKILMSNGLLGKVHYIGTKVIDLLEDLGWNSKTIKIKSDAIQDNDIVPNNPNITYSFYCTPSTDILSYKWSFEIPQQNNSYRIISTGTNSSFSTSVPNSYFDNDVRTSSGIIKGRIRAILTMTDNKEMIVDYALSIPFKPAEPSFALLDTIPVSEYSNDLVVGFGSFGANYYIVNLEDVDYGVATNYIAPQGEYCSQTFPNIFVGENYLVTITAHNNYGESEPYVFELFDVFTNTLNKYHSDPSYDLLLNSDGMTINYLDRCLVPIFDKSNYISASWKIDLFYDKKGVTNRVKYFSEATEGNSPYKFNFKDIIANYGYPNSIIDGSQLSLWKHTEDNKTSAQIVFEGITIDNAIKRDTIDVLLNLSLAIPEFDIISFTHDKEYNMIAISFKGKSPENTPPPILYSTTWRNEDGIVWIDKNPTESYSWDWWFTNSLEDRIDIHAYNGFGFSLANSFYPLNQSSIEPIVKNSNISIYSNPASNFIRLSTHDTPYAGSIYNVFGQKICDINSELSSIDISAFPCGTYIIKIILNNKKTKNLKFVKH